MKVAILKNTQGAGSRFEHSLAIALQRSKLEGYGLFGFEVNRGGTLYEIDGILILKTGVIVCLEAKNYPGKWEGSANDKWFCNGNEIKSSHGLNPYTQVKEYTYVIKNKLEETGFSNTKFWVNSFVIAPNGTDLSGVDGVVINQFQSGKSICICNLDNLERVLSSIWQNNDIAILCTVRT